MSDDVSVRLKTEIKELQEVGYFISTSNQEKIIEVQNLLKKYKNIVEVSNHLVDKIESIDFSKKLNYIDTKIQLLSGELVATQTSIEQYQTTIQTQLIQRLEKQDQVIKLIRNFLMLIGGQKL